MVSLRSKPSILAALDVYPSELLPQLFLGYDQETIPANILDVGAGNSQTLEAFAFYRSKIHFLDLLSISLPEQGSGTRQEAYAQHAFTEALSDCQGVVFDLCLFWDLLVALTQPALRGFNAALAPFLSNQSQGYAACQLFPDSDGQLWRYRIQDAQHLVRLAPELSTTKPVARSVDETSAHPLNPSLDGALDRSLASFLDTPGGWSHTQFVERFDCLPIAADRLHPEGRLELLFRFR